MQREKNAHGEKAEIVPFSMQAMDFKSRLLTMTIAYVFNQIFFTVN